MLVKLDIQDGGILKAKTNRILDIGHSHEAAVMVGHILDGGGEVMRLQRVIAHKSEMKEDLAYYILLGHSHFLGQPVKHLEVVAFNEELRNRGQSNKDQKAFFFLLLAQHLIDEGLEVFKVLEIEAEPEVIEARVLTSYRTDHV